MKSIRVTKLVNLVRNWVVTRICDVDMEKVQKYKNYPSTNVSNRTSILLHVNLEFIFIHIHKHLFGQIGHPTINCWVCFFTCQVASNTSVPDSGILFTINMRLCRWNNYSNIVFALFFLYVLLFCGFLSIKVAQVLLTSRWIIVLFTFNG
jgi:hypothetical protein